MAKSKLGIDDASWRSILAQLAGVNSSTELDVAGLNAIMGCFEWLLGVRPTVLVVPPSLEALIHSWALRILNTENESGGGAGPWKGTAELIASPRSAIRKVGTDFRLKLRDK